MAKEKKGINFTSLSEKLKGRTIESVAVGKDETLFKIVLQDGAQVAIRLETEAVPDGRSHPIVNPFNPHGEVGIRVLFGIDIFFEEKKEES